MIRNLPPIRSMGWVGNMVLFIMHTRGIRCTSSILPGQTWPWSILPSKSWCPSQATPYVIIIITQKLYVSIELNHHHRNYNRNPIANDLDFANRFAVLFDLSCLVYILLSTYYIALIKRQRARIEAGLDSFSGRLSNLGKQR